MTAPTAPLTSMLARKWRIEVDTGGDPEEPTWTPVRGVTNFTPGVTPTTQETDDYDSDGWGSQEKTLLRWNLAVQIIRKGEDSATPDAGQEALRLKGDQFGAAGTAHVRWYDRNGGPEAYEGHADVSWEPQGGATADVENVTINLSGKGARITIDNPADEE